MSNRFVLFRSDNSHLTPHFLHISLCGKNSKAIWMGKNVAKIKVQDFIFKYCGGKFLSSLAICWYHASTGSKD